MSHPGKFEANADPERAEFLYHESLDWDSGRTGDVDTFGVYASLLVDVLVPWSDTPETWTVEENADGFVVATPGRARFDDYAREYDAFAAGSFGE